VNSKSNCAKPSSKPQKSNINKDDQPMEEEKKGDSMNTLNTPIMTEKNKPIIPVFSSKNFAD